MNVLIGCEFSGVETRAFTYSKFSGQEVLGLEEMRAMYGPEFACAD